MGSPLSPIVSDMVMTDVELHAIDKLKFNLPFYFRYVDDIFTMVPHSHINDVLDTFNSVHERIQFTVEIGTNNSIHFMNVTVHLLNEGFIFNWYRKPTFSGRFLNFYSQHPTAHKKGVVVGLIDRVVCLSHPQFYQENFLLIIDILLNNGYPLHFIFNNIMERLQHYSHHTKNNKKPVTDRNFNETDKNNWFILPYTNNFSNKFQFVSKKYGFKLAYTIQNKLHFIKKHKDKIDYNTQCNIVYKIPCGECDATYVGQSKRQLNTRVVEHRNSVRRGTSNSVISEHSFHSGHEFDWNNVKIVDRENEYKKRLISEMISIKRQVNGINIQSDTDFLPNVYDHVIGLLSPL